MSKRELSGYGLISRLEICVDLKKVNVALSLIVMIGVFGLMSCFKEETTFPNKEIEFIVPWGEGGGTDLISRELIGGLEMKVGWPVRIEYRTGGGGVNGHGYLANIEPSGYFIGAVTSELTLMHWQGLTDLTYKDYTHFVLLGLDAATVAVRYDSPWITLEQLLAEIKNNPDVRYYASGTARGGIWDLARIGLLKNVGLNSSSLEWLGSQGAESALRMLLKDEIQVLFAGVPEVLKAADSKEIRVLAVMSENRPSVLREVPTLRELNIDFEISGWVAIAGPPGIPDRIADTLSTTLAETAATRAFQEQLKQAGFEPRLRVGKELVEFLELEDQRNGQLLEWAGLRVQ